MCWRCSLRTVAILSCIASLGVVQTSGTAHLSIATTDFHTSAISGRCTLSTLPRRTKTSSASKKDAVTSHTPAAGRALPTAFVLGLQPRLRRSNPAAISSKACFGGNVKRLVLHEPVRRSSWGRTQPGSRLSGFARLAMQERSDTDRARLEQLFRSDSDASAGSIPDEERIQRTTLAFGDELPDPRVLPNLFVWKPDSRSPIMLPGLQQVLMVQEPHHCHMFETILSGKLPHRFIYLYANEDASAPQLGVLAQVGACKRLHDNRLLLLVMGEARVSVTEQAGLTMPFSRAACTVLPDEEEIEHYLELATGSVMGALRRTEHLSQDVLATVHDGYFTSAARITATAAAAAASLAWTELELPVSLMVEGAKLDSIADVVDLNAAAVPETVAQGVQDVAATAAAAVAHRALREVGYRPMMHEADGRYEGDGLGSLEEENLPPSWLVALDHFEERMGGTERESVGGEQSEVSEEEEEVVGRGAPVLRVLSGKAVEVVGEMERRVWVKLDEAMMLRAAVTEGGGGATRTVARLPEEIRRLRPKRAPSGWPTLRRASRLSYAMASLLKKLGRAREDGGTHKLLGARSIEERLEVVLGELEQSSAQLRAMLALRAASESPGDKDDDLDDGYPSCTA